MKSDVTLAGLTLAQRSELLSMARARDLARRGSELPPIQPAARDERVPLSFAQQRLWFLAQLRDLGTTYHIPRRLRLRGELDRDALVCALDRIVARHEVLRTTFAQVDGVPEQRIAPADGGFHLVEHDLAERTDAEAELDRLVTEEGRAPFDLEHGPLIRGRLIRVGADDHVLLITMHHIVSDAWSMGVLMRELGTLYAAFRRGAPDPLPALEVQYADYAVWQRRRVDGVVLQEQAEYWTRTLAGAPELLELPTDHPRPAQMDHAGAQLALELDAELTAGLKALSRRNGTTLFMTLLAGFAVVLSRLSGQDDVVIGSPMAGRGRREIEGLIGFFVNTLALRLDLSGAPTVAELLGRVKERVIQAQHNQDIPFEQVVDLVDPARSLAHHPLFQALFAWQNTPRAGGLSLPGLEAGGVGGGAAATLAQAQANRDLSLSLREAGDRIVGNVVYATALYERETVARWVGYLRRALEEMVADESRPVAQLTLMPADERVRVLKEWNRTQAGYPRESCIHHLFEQQVERTPDATAVVYESERLTYAELNARANRLAHHLRALGVGPDAPVAICVERGLETMVGLLAILKAGGAYVPLDPGYPAERLAYMLADSAPAAVLTQRALRDRVQDAGVPVLELDAAAPVWASEAETNPARGALTPEHAAYVIYTSGSTGMPKGVIVPHRAVVSQLAWAQRTWTLGAHEAVLQRISLSFDVSVRELFWALTVGARVVLAGPAGANDPAALVEVIAREGVGAIHSVPTLLQAFLEHPEVGSCTTLARVMCGGEVLSPALARRFHERLPNATLYHMYGPTETTVAVTAARSRPEERHGRLPLGRPIANTRAYVLDDRGEPVPVGAAGELCIGGAQLARGYLGRADLTAERFVADPFAGEPGARMYRTGDLARWLPDGRLEFLGRTDHQVKLRGFRIEPGEIEARLLEHPMVREAVVVVRQDAPGEKRLAAYVVGDEVGADALRAHVSETLPEYMVPAAYVRLDALPLTPNGKVDRKSLPAPEEDAFAARLYEAPLDDAEQVLADIWAEVLRVERVGRGDHFFELGGHSLLAVQVVSRVRQALQVEVALGELFTRPVLGDFARGLKTAARSELPPIEPASREGRLPLSFAQQRLWFLEQLGNLGSTYHMGTRLRLRGALDRGALARALDGLVARHEALRTTFAQVDGAPEQRIAPAEAAGFHLVDHDLAGRTDAEAELGRLLGEEARAPFDLERGPLIRGRLVRLDGDDHVLLVTMHHIVSDGWSMGVLTHELSVLYAAHREGGKAVLPSLPVQYADYAAWQRRWVEGEVLRQQAEYWTRTLAGAPELLELPTDRPRPAQMDHAGGQLRVVLGQELTAGLKALSRRHGTTLFMTLLAGWAVVLSRLSGHKDVVVGTPAANRGRREIEGLIGFFVNTLALRVDLSGAPTVAELLTRVKERVLQAQHNQDIPFEQVVERVAPARSLSHTPVFQVLFAWQNMPRGGLELPGLTVGAMGAPDERGAAKQDLTLTLGEANGRIAGSVVYATALFERGTIDRWLGYLRRVLEEMAADESLPVERLALMPPGERLRIVEEWNRTAAEYPAGSCIHELFEQQVERTPHAAAVVFEGQELTCAELNARANRLAHHLRSLGVGPDARVAICVERGLDMTVGLLAVLKAGGAYLPLDPEYPQERLRWMLEDGEPAAVLVQEALRGGREALFGGLAVPVLALDHPAPCWAGESDLNPERGGLTPDHLAYVIYTSGSTGRPKGVMIPHRGLTHYLWWARGRYAEDAPRGFAVYSSIAFDLTVTSIFVPLLTGGTAIAYPEGAGDDLAVLRVAEDDRVDVAKVTPSHLVLLEGRDWRAGTLVVGGEDLKTPLARAVQAAPGRRLAIYNEYGPTETVVGCMIHRFDAGVDRSPSVPIGRPIANMRVYVLDGRGEPVPVGVAGELYIGGVQMARGYLGRPALTAERFVPDPWGEPGARLYRTGDLARWRSDGTAEFLGRMDHQVKVRGYRIELGEIEARLVEHAGVREAVVVAREDTPGDTRLAAYWVGEAVEAETLRARLGAALPAYMVPAAYVRLEQWPLTPNGKLDRRALPAPEGDAFARGGYEAPQTETEQALAEIWSEVLGVERVGRRDGFFELGGHSLLVVTLIARMRRQGLHADVRTVFAAPTLAALAAAVAGESSEVRVPPNLIPSGCEAITPEMLPLVALTRTEVDSIVATVPGGAANVQDIYPLAPLQEGFLFHHLLSTGGDPYLLGTLATFATRERLDAYLQALRAVIARHDILRTSVVWEGLGEPVQVVWRQAPLLVDEVELDPAGDDAAEQLYRRFDPRHHRIDLGRAPLLRCHVARDAARERWVLLQLRHHLAGDHTAGEVLQDEIQAHLRGEADRLPAPQPFRNYVAQVRLGVSQEEHRAFFTELLGDVDEPTAPFGLLDVRGDGSGVDEARLQVDGELVARLRERARALGVSAAALLHLAWAQVLGRASGREDVVFGTVLFGRMQGGEGADRSMGLFINTLPVRVRLGSVGVEAGARRTHAVLAGLLRHEHAPLSLAQRCSAVEASAPLFTALLNYRHGRKQTRPDAPPAPAAPDGARRLTEERSNYPLTMSVDDLGGAMRLTAKVRGDVEAGRVCAMMHTALAGLVQALETAPERPVGSIGVLPPEERARVLYDWNRTEAAYPGGACMHQLIEAQAARTPDAQAVAFEGERLTYAELNARANRLAHHLRALGAGPDARVGICVERSPEMVVGMLAVLKAGGAYVPLDPSYPVDRLQYMLADSAPAAVLTQARLRGRVQDAGVPVLELDAPAPAWADRPAANPVVQGLAPGHLAYLTYTSGSTGRPKGVMNAHRGLVNRLAWMQERHGLQAGEGVLQNSSFSFDASVFEIFWPLMVGGRVVLPRPDGHRDPEHLIGVIRGERVSTAYFVCSMLQLFLEYEGAGRCTDLTRLLCGGEPLSPSLAQRVRERLPRVRLHNLYGPTESAVSVTGPVGAGDDALATVPIGRPAPNVRVYFLDPHGEPVPVGVAGELYVGGAQLARGYLGRPALTAERFVPDPFGAGPGARLYRTGDLGRWRADGRIEFLGRTDFQVKVRGFRIEPAEIEARLARHPAVREAVVMAREETPGDTRLVAYWVGDAVEAEALRAHLGEALPAYMVPAAYVRLEEWPRTPNGKLDRKALPAPDGEVCAAREYEAPVGETEQALAAIWAEVLGVRRVGRHDDFFEAGGHSLLATRLVVRIKHEMEVELALRDVFDTPRLSQLAQRVLDAQLAQFDPARLAELAELADLAGALGGD